MCQFFVCGAIATVLLKDSTGILWSQQEENRMKIYEEGSQELKGRKLRGTAMNIKMRKSLLYPLFSFMEQRMSLLGAKKNNKKRKRENQSFLWCDLYVIVESTIQLQSSLEWKIYMVIMIKATSEGIQNNWNKLLNLRGLSIYSMFLVEIFLPKEKGRHSESLFSPKYSTEL